MLAVGGFKGGQVVGSSDAGSQLAEGHATIAEKLVAHDAAPAEDLMQAFFYRHLVPWQELAVTVNGPPRPFMRDAFKIIGTPRWKSRWAARRAGAPPGNFAGRFNLELDNAPEGISLANVSRPPAGLELVFNSDADKVKPGATGNLICDVVPKNLGPGNLRKKPATSRAGRR